MLEESLFNPISTTPNTEKKGVPGFSERLNFVFDLADAPSDTRLSWGAKRWSVVPNTVKNWVKGDIPPQHFATLELVVNDLLEMIKSNVDKTAVIGWLYAGGQNPFDVKSRNTYQNELPPINHMLQMKIFNKLYELGLEKNLDVNKVEEQKINRIINSVYFKIIYKRETEPEFDVLDVVPLLRTFINTIG